MYFTRIAYCKQVPDTHVRKIDFFDTRFASVLMNHFTKFSRVAPKDRDKFSFQRNLMEYFVNEDGSPILAERIYFPFNFDKQHWVIVCVDKVVHVLDCHIAFRSENLMKKDLLPVAQMLPYVLKEIMPETKLLSLARVHEIPQNCIHEDLAVTVMLLIQAHANAGVEGCKCIIPEELAMDAQKLAALIYEEFA